MRHILKNIEEIILIILLVTMTIVMGVQIVSRYVFQNSLSWSEELTRFLFIWFAFVGWSYSVKEDTIIRIDVFKQKFSPKLKKGFDSMVFVVLFFTSVLIFIYGLQVVLASMKSGQTSAAMGIPIWIVQFSVPFGAMLATVRLLARKVPVMKNFKSGRR